MEMLSADFYVVFSFLDGVRHRETYPNTFYGCSNRIVLMLYGILQRSCPSNALNIGQMNVMMSFTRSRCTASLSQLQ